MQPCWGLSPPQRSSAPLACTWCVGQGMHMLTGETTNCKWRGRTLPSCVIYFCPPAAHWPYEMSWIWHCSPRPFAFIYLKKFACSFVLVCLPPKKRILTSSAYFVAENTGAGGVHKGVVFKVSAWRYKWRLYCVVFRYIQRYLHILSLRMEHSNNKQSSSMTIYDWKSTSPLNTK